MKTSGNHGMSLLEVVVGLALMGIAMAAVVQFLGSNRDVADFEAAEDELNRDASIVMRVLAADLSQSGWYSPGSTTLPIDWPTDRTARYWPYVLWQTPLGANPTGFGFAQRAPSHVLLNLENKIMGFSLGETNSAHVGATFGIANRQAYLNSFHAPSQELLFLKQITEDKWDDKSVIRRAQSTIPFPDGDWTDTSETNRAALGILHPSVWKETTPGSNVWVGRAFDANGDGTIGLNEGLDGSGKPLASYGVPMMAAELNATDTSSFRFQTAWETVTAPLYDSAAIQNGNLREYMYAVVPTSSGLGRLVRAFKDVPTVYPNARYGDPRSLLSTGVDPISGIAYGMRVEEVLSDNVVRVVFDTARTDQTLSLNQIRARIYFLCKSQHHEDVYVHKLLDVVFAMRARNTGVERASDRKIFLDAGRFPPEL